MRQAITLGFACVGATLMMTATAQLQSPDDSLRIYSVNVIKTTPFEKPFSGYGVYLGRGVVLTAAHVIGRWGFLKNPRVLVAGQDLPASIIKEGSLATVDLTLLSVDEKQLPVSLRLRRNPLCTQPPRIHQDVIVVLPDKTAHTRVISPTQIDSTLRQQFSTLIDDLIGASGSAVFDANRKCLLGIISRKIQKLEYQEENGKIAAKPNGYAGYFVPAIQIRVFMPTELRF